MFYTIYKTTNKINGKIYIGKHQTKDLNDSYIGSGRHLNRAIKKYGLENFEKEILYIFDNEDDMNAKEADLVSEEFVKEDTNYNLCPGGKGGWGYINNNEELIRKRTKKMISNIKWKEKAIINGTNNLLCPHNRKKAIKNHKILFPDGTKGFTGKSHSEETKKKISGPREKSQGSRNSQHGTMWITDGSESKKMKKTEKIPEGWYKGRVIKKYTSTV